jgi:uncharacterized membrane protein
MDDVHAQHPSHGNPRSTARIGGHPIHPMLVPFPIVCFIGAFATDMAFIANGEPAWATASNWLLGVGLGIAVLAATLIDFFGDPLVRGHSDAVKHMVANISAVALEAVNLVLRLGNPDFIGSTGIYMSGIVVLILLYRGWKGGELVYRHGVGVLDRHSR